MATLTFKNSRGELVDIPTVAATRVKNEFGQILDQATHTGAIAITRHDTTKAVLLSLTEFESLVSERSRTLSALSSDFDQILARMQTAESRKGMKAAFNASPARLGSAAVKGARRREAGAKRRSKLDNMLKDLDSEVLTKNVIIPGDLTYVRRRPSPIKDSMAAKNVSSAKSALSKPPRIANTGLKK